MTLAQLIDALTQLPKDSLPLSVEVQFRGGQWPVQDVRIEGQDRNRVIVIDGTPRQRRTPAPGISFPPA